MIPLISPPGTGRLAVRVSPNRDGRAALDIYRPLAGRGRLLRRGLVLACLVPGTRTRVDPLVDAVADYLDIAAQGACVLASSKPGRSVIGFAVGGRLRAVAKVGRLDDDGLRREGAVLDRLSPLGGVRVPRLLASGELQDRFVCATAPVSGRPARSWSGALRVCVALAAGGWTHGDLVPWNLLEHPTTLLDWERAQQPLLPLHDLSHYVLQSAALLGTADPRSVVRWLCGPDGPGRRCRAELGLAGTPAVEHLAAYLDRMESRPGSPAELRFRHDVRKVLPCAS